MTNKTKQHWNKVRELLDQLQPYNYEETRALLLEGELFKKYQGKAKNRTFVKEHPKLYNQYFNIQRF